MSTVPFDFRSPSPPDSAWHQALGILGDVLRRAKCPPDVLGDALEQVRVHKMKRDRARRVVVKTKRLA